MKKLTTLIIICLFVYITAKSQSSDSLIIWSLANNTSATYISPQLKAMGEMFGNKITNVTYGSGYQKIAAPSSGWTNTIDTTTTAGVYIDFPFGLVANYNIGYGCTFINLNNIILSGYTDATSDSIKITPYLYDSSLYVDSSIFCFWDTLNVHPITYSCGGGIGYDYYKYINGHWYYFNLNATFTYDSSIIINYYQELYQQLYPVKKVVNKGNEFYISSNSASNPNNILNHINYNNNNININNERLLFLRLYISSSNPNANLYLKQAAIDGGFFYLLPITFSSFTATKNNNNILLNWQMKDETNIDKYVVEKAVVQDEFKPMTTVVSVNKSNYNIVDEAPNKGDNFYRIKAISKDSKIIYSSVVKVVFGVNGISIKINPNPVKNILYASVENKKDENVIVQITDMQGKVLQQKKVQLQVGCNNFYVSTIGLKAGAYSLIVNGSNKQTIQFIKD